MTPKKNTKYDTESKYGLFLSIGLILSIILIISAFEWRSKKEILDRESDEPIESKEEILEEIPITLQNPPPMDIPKIEQPEIKEVPDEEEIKKEVETTFEPEKPSEIHVEQTQPIEAPVAPVEKPDQIFTIVEEKPNPQGGLNSFYQFLKDNIKYPKKARKAGVKGKVFLQFVVEKDGSLTDIKVMKGIGYDCDEEAVRVLKMAPKWSPGKQRGKPVRVRMSIPINFTFR